MTQSLFRHGDRALPLIGSGSSSSSSSLVDLETMVSASMGCSIPPDRYYTSSRIRRTLANPALSHVPRQVQTEWHVCPGDTFLTPCSSTIRSQLTPTLRFKKLRIPMMRGISSRKMIGPHKLHCQWQVRWRVLLFDIPVQQYHACRPLARPSLLEGFIYP